MKLFQQEWESRKIKEKYMSLVENSFFIDDIDAYKEQINNLDSEITEIMIRAEIKCTAMASHHLDVWTPELIAAMKNKRYWKTQLTKAQKLPFKLVIVDSLNNYKEVHSKYTEATKEYSKLCKTAKDDRKFFLQERAKYAALLKNTKAEKEIKIIIETERQHEHAQRINTVMKGRHGGGPNSILIPAITEYDITSLLALIWSPSRGL